MQVLAFYYSESNCTEGDSVFPHLRSYAVFAAQTRNTMRIFSSAEYCRPVARRISQTRFSASSDSVSAFDLIAAPCAGNTTTIQTT
jgi:hypothetical protein